MCLFFSVLAIIKIVIILNLFQERAQHPEIFVADKLCSK